MKLALTDFSTVRPAHERLIKEDGKFLQKKYDSADSRTKRQGKNVTDYGSWPRNASGRAE